MPARRRRLALTLSELLVVVVVLGVISLIVVPSFQTVLGRSEVEAQLARDEAVARNSAALLAFRDGTTPAQALTIAVSELPPAPGVTASNGYTVGTDASDSPEVFSYALNAGNLEFVTMHDADTAIGCFVHQLGISSNCAVIELDSPSSEVGAGDVTIPGTGGGLAGGGGGGVTTTAPPPPEPVYADIVARRNASLPLVVPGGAELAGQNVYAIFHVESDSSGYYRSGWTQVGSYVNGPSDYRFQVLQRDTPHSGQAANESAWFSRDRAIAGWAAGVITVQPGTYEGMTHGDDPWATNGTTVLDTTLAGDATVTLAHSYKRYCVLSVSSPAALIETEQVSWNYSYDKWFLTTSDGTAQGIAAGHSSCSHIRWASMHFTSS